MTRIDICLVEDYVCAAFAFVPVFDGYGIEMIKDQLALATCDIRLLSRGSRPLLRMPFYKTMHNLDRLLKNLKDFSSMLY